MTDYLELLLERRQEEDEERESLRLGAEGKGSFSRRSRTVRGESPERPGGAGTNLLGTAADMGADMPPFSGPALPQAGGIGAALRRKTAWDEPEQAPEQTLEQTLGRTLGRTPGWTPGRAADALDAPEAEGIGDAPRRKTAWDALEQALGRIADALGEAERDGPRHGLSGLSEAGTVSPSGGAAGLARRLSHAALASAAAPARTVFDSVAEEGTPAADWEEFDRRLERDARRYDGGIGIF